MQETLGFILSICIECREHIDECTCPFWALSDTESSSNS